jgi:hypothetical protein
MASAATAACKGVLPVLSGELASAPASNSLLAASALAYLQNQPSINLLLLTGSGEFSTNIKTCAKLGTDGDHPLFSSEMFGFKQQTYYLIVSPCIEKFHYYTNG